MILPGIYSYNGEPIAAKESKPAPVAGVFLHIPLGSDKGTDCRKIVELETAMLKLQNAKQLFMDGLITKEQLEEVVQLTYETISSAD